jgi:hypothetical protein
VTWVDVELALVGLVAMLEPATLISSILALVLTDRPVRTGVWFFLGGVGATMSVGVLGAFVLGDAAASSTRTPKTWVSIFGIVAGVCLLGYVFVMLRRPRDAEKAAATVERIGKLGTAPAITIVGAGAVLANAGPFMLFALKAISQLDPSTGRYVVDWLVFALASLLPLGLALVMLVLAPTRTLGVLRSTQRGVERHARTIASVLLVALAASLLREGFSGLTA